MDLQKYLDEVAEIIRTAKIADERQAAMLTRHLQEIVTEAAKAAEMAAVLGQMGVAK